MNLLSEFSQLKESYKVHLKRFCGDTTADYLILGASRFICYLQSTGVLSVTEIRYTHCEIWIYNLKHHRKLREESLFFNARCVKHFIKFLILNFSSIRMYFPGSFEFYERPVRKPPINTLEDRSIEMLLNILRQNLNTYLNWRSYMILRLLLSTKLSIKEILNLKDSGINISKRRINESKGRKAIKCSKSLFNDLLEFQKARDEYVSPNSDYLMRSMHGFHMDYFSTVREDIYKQWRLYASVNINSKLIKAYRLARLQNSSNPKLFREIQGSERQNSEIIFNK